MLEIRKKVNYKQNQSRVMIYLDCNSIGTGKVNGPINPCIGNEQDDNHGNFTAVYK